MVGRQNLPPVSNAGLDQNILIPNANSPGRTTLDGTGSSDPEGDVLVFAWAQDSGPSTAQILSPSESKTDVAGLLPGDYSFSLKVADNAGNSNVDAVKVSVAIRGGDDAPRAKSCGPLADILRAFETFDQNRNNEAFAKFVEMFRDYGQVRELFQGMQSIAASDPNAQISFFQGAFARNGIVDRLAAWLERLQIIILEFADLRGLAFQLYRILAVLSMYIVCIQKGDFDQDPIPTQKVFQVMLSHAKVWSEMRDSGQFGRVEILLIARIGNDVAVATALTEQNGEVSTKPKYLSFLKDWSEIL